MRELHIVRCIIVPIETCYDDPRGQVTRLARFDAGSLFCPFLENVAARLGRKVEAVNVTCFIGKCWFIYR